MNALAILLIVAGAVAVAAFASAHAILYKRDVRSAIGWAGFIWLFPYAGALIYYLFGVNRIRRKAAVLRARVRPRPPRGAPLAARPNEFSRTGDRLLQRPMTTGNRVTIHTTGEQAFAHALQAIGNARRTVTLSMYIFEDDHTGRDVVAALAAAAARGVQVRVLIDAVGSRRSGRKVVADLERAGVRAAQFLPPRLPGLRSLNLRNHRKLLVVDGTEAFTGGMNIADSYARTTGSMPIRDTAFAITGPVVADLQDTFAEDWQFTTGELLEGAEWFATPVASGSVIARGLADGPDENFELARWVVLGAISSARRSIRIVTPYFVPDVPLIAALGVASLRGVRVEVYIPEVLDHRVVKWASNALLWQILEKGCRVWFTPPPFDHSKLFTVDGVWSLIGSANWDSRSIRLNFELNVELFDATIVRAIDHLIDARRAVAREITLADVDARTLPVRLRDGLARLLSPYL